MHVRVRLVGLPEAVITVTSKLTKIEEFRRILKHKYELEPNSLRLLYGGKVLEDGYTFHDYNIKLNDVIQVMIRMAPDKTSKEKRPNKNENKGKEKEPTTKNDTYPDTLKEEDFKDYIDAECLLYAIGDLVDIKHHEFGAWFEGEIIRIVHPNASGTSVKLASSTPSSSQEKINEPQEKINEPQENINEPQEKINEPHEKINEPQEKINEPQAKINEPQDEIKEPQEKIDEPQNKIKEPQEKIDETQEKIDETQEKIDETQEKIDETQEKINEPQEKINEPQNINEPQEMINKPQDKINEPQQKMNETQEKMNETQEKMNETQEKINETQEKINEPQEKINEPQVSGSSKPKMGIKKYFSPTSQVLTKEQPKKEEKGEVSQNLITEQNLLYIVKREEDGYGEFHLCNLNEIRPRARKLLDVKTLNDEMVMINHNIERPIEKGLWYDFKICEKKNVVEQFDNYWQLVGTLFAGSRVLENVTMRVHDNIYGIESVVPLAKRTSEYRRLMITPSQKRVIIPMCMTCRDNNDVPCQDCGCYTCSGKESPDKIVLCDECGLGFHLECLDPVMTVVPDDDWYCEFCKRSPNEVVAPGGAKQKKKASKSARDWGRGMACVGKTKTCSMPANHFGPIPGIEVGMSWLFRIQLSETGVHRPPVSGIHGRDKHGAYSLVLSGGYEDDEDFGVEFTYTGSGGRDLSGNRRTAGQSHDQTLTRENRALARNCAVSAISEEGADAGDNWREGLPVRVVRSSKMGSHFPDFAPKVGLRYDGIYKVVKYYPEQGRSGFRVWKYLLRRDDPIPAPWEVDTELFPIIYPDGYLESEAEKKRLKGKSCPTSAPKRSKKRALPESEGEGDFSPAKEPPRKKITVKQTEAERKKLKGKSCPNSAPKRSKKPDPAAAPAPQKASDEKSAGEGGSSQPEQPEKGESSQKRGRGRPPKARKGSKSSDGESKPKTYKSSARQQLAEAQACRLTDEELAAINADTVNASLWTECVEICDSQGMRDFVEHVTQVFKCIICQEVIARPVTTPCGHNFCGACIKRALKNCDGHLGCPCCRHSLEHYRPETNRALQTALRTVLPGYDAGK